MGAQQPYMYSAARSWDDGRFPSKPFDPKAVTRASYDYKPPKPKPEGPLVSFNRHPDSHVVPEPRKHYKALGPWTKQWIKRLRMVQIGFRALELVAAAGILFLFIVINKVSSLTAWVERITAGVVVMHCIYGIFHLARPAGSRPPASSAGYQTFSGITDLAVLPLYAYGCLSVRNAGGHWGTLLSDASLMNYFLPALYYTLFVGAVLHFISLCIGFWLAIKFRQIAYLPPDMNPLEDNLTSRHNKKLSIATTSTYQSGPSDRLSTPLEEHHRSGMPYEDIDRPPSMPFHATRSSPRSSVDLPPRQYQMVHGDSPRNSVDLKRMSAPPSSSASSIPPTPPPRSPWRLSQQQMYAEVPSQDLTDFRAPYSRGSGQSSPTSRSRGHQSRPSTANTAVVPQQQDGQTSPSRPPKFTEAWYTTESLFGRTHDRNRAMKPSKSETPVNGYEAIRRRYDLSDSESDYENETATAYSIISPPRTEIDDGDLASQVHQHPNPLRAHPSIPSLSNSSVAGKTKQRMRPNTPFNHHKVALTEIDLNDRRVSGGSLAEPKVGGDITDEKPSLGSKNSNKHNAGKRFTWAPRDRVSSIQADEDFHAGKPYGDLKSRTPPIMVGSDRQVSSGNDYDFNNVGGGQASQRYFSFGKRSVSGKVAEEGRGSLSIGWAR